jgi:hypothetical protein
VLETPGQVQFGAKPHQEVHPQAGTILCSLAPVKTAWYRYLMRKLTRVSQWYADIAAYLSGLSTEFHRSTRRSPVVWFHMRDLCQESHEGGDLPMAQRAAVMVSTRGRVVADLLLKTSMHSMCFESAQCEEGDAWSLQSWPARTLWTRRLDTRLVEIFHLAAVDFQCGIPRGRSVGTSDQTPIMSALPLAGVTVIEVRGEDVARSLMYRI